MNRRRKWYLKHRLRKMEEAGRKEIQVIHGQEVEVTVLPEADVTGEFPHRPNVRQVRRTDRASGDY